MIVLENQFYEHFDIVAVTNSHLLEQVFRLRYEVLCVEKGIKSFVEKNIQDSLEQDVYDIRSQHFLIYHKKSEIFAATVRLIFTDGSNDLSAFPMIKAGYKHLNVPALELLPQDRIGEISRLLIRKEFRRRFDRSLFDSDVDYKNYIHLSRKNRLITHPVLGLLTAIMKMSHENNINYWLAGMEASLNRRLAQLGLFMTPLGPTIEYHGHRRPYIGYIHEVINALYFSNNEIWRFITEQGKLWPAPKIVTGHPRHAG